MAKEENTGKIGDGHLAAMARLGLHELRNTVYPESNIAQQHGEYGLVGTRTPGEIAEARESTSLDHDEEKGSILEAAMERAQAEEDRAPEAREPELERD